MTDSTAFIIAIIGVVGVLVTQFGNAMLSWSNGRRIDKQQAMLAEQAGEQAKQSRQLTEIHVTVNGNLSHMRDDLTVAVARIVELTESQEQLRAASTVGDLPSKSALVAAVAGVAAVVAAAPEASAALQQIVARVQETAKDSPSAAAASLAAIPTDKPKGT